MDQLSALFVYGSLQPGAENEKYLQDIRGSWKQGYVLGNLVTEGWGTKIGFPAIKVNEQGDQIKGWLLESDELQAHLKRLDEFEGDEYQRIIAKIYLDDGTTTHAYLYELADRDE